MSGVSNEEQSEAIKRFLDVRESLKLPAPFQPYEWLQTPDKYVLNQKWGNEKLRFFAFAEEGARELANSVNHFIGNCRSLAAWRIVLDDMDIKLAREMRFDFVRDLASITLLMPYSIKARFYFYVAHISHHANSLRDDEVWRDSFEALPEDSAIKKDHADRLARGWKAGKKLVQGLDRCNGKKFKESSKDFRSKFTHRFEPNLEEGLSQTVKRLKVDGQSHAAYGLGGTPPVLLSEIVPSLENECQYFVKAYSRFQDLVGEQCDSVMKISQKE